jgi:polysaccharide export outer membrane protein
MKYYFSLFSLLLIISSCSIKQKMVYFQQENEINSEIKNANPKIKIDDLLSINVYSSDITASIPFNLPIPTQQTNSGYTVGNQAQPGYLVDSQGDINIPIIGKINVKDKTRAEITDLLEQKLSEYLVKPVVSIRILNFKITVLGEVNNPGTYTIPNERISVLEAIGLAGDLTLMGLRQNILIIRDENGIKKQFRIDLTKSEFMNSPFYYLQQNDVLYIEPNKTKINSSRINTSNIGIVISAISLIITTSVLIFK